MMTLLEIATNACATMALDDSATIDQAKAFVRKRWQLLWSSELWPQARTLATLALTAGTDIVALPATMEMPTLVRRSEDGTVIPVEHELAAMLCDPDAFRAKAGTPMFWTLIEPAGGFARLRFSAAPAENLALTAVGKAPCPALALDTDRPTIPGADLALIAFVEADLYEWTRQVGKAQVKLQEAAGLRQVMLDQALAQSGQITRIVPWDDGGPGLTLYGKS
ncbi:MAG: hypothetical protein RL077_363 [Verrucomicrobiota bacterium]|jgi:hypothetical protein